MLKWQKKLASTSQSYPCKGSFYSWYIFINRNIFFDCKYIYDTKDKQFKLIVVKYILNVGETHGTIIKEYPHDKKFMKEAKKLVEEIIEIDYKISI